MVFPIAGRCVSNTHGTYELNLIISKIERTVNSKNIVSHTNGLNDPLIAAGLFVTNGAIGQIKEYKKFIPGNYERVLTNNRNSGLLLRAIDGGLMMATPGVQGMFAVYGYPHLVFSY